MANRYWFRPAEERRRGKCEECGGRLRKNPSRRDRAEHETSAWYRETCPRCGHRQSWAPTLNTGAEQGV